MDSEPQGIDQLNWPSEKVEKATHWIYGLLALGGVALIGRMPHVEVVSFETFRTARTQEFVADGVILLMGCLHYSSVAWSKSMAKPIAHLDAKEIKIRRLVPLFLSLVCIVIFGVYCLVDSTKAPPKPEHAGASTSISDRDFYSSAASGDLPRLKGALLLVVLFGYAGSVSTWKKPKLQSSASGTPTIQPPPLA